MQASEQYGKFEKNSGRLENRTRRAEAREGKGRGRRRRHEAEERAIVIRKHHIGRDESRVKTRAMRSRSRKDQEWKRERACYGQQLARAEESRYRLNAMIAANEKNLV